MKCPPRGDIREFLDELRTKREELDQVGIVINDNDHRSTIIASLPSTLASFASATLSAAQLFTTTKTVEPDTLIMLLKEAEREVCVCAKGREGQGERGGAVGSTKREKGPVIGTRKDPQQRWMEGNASFEGRWC